jgi:multimeric flavodoxin WrbA
VAGETARHFCLPESAGGEHVKIFGVTAGRKMGNTEILLREAFLAAEELGAEVEMVNLHDVKIVPCDGCESCTIKVTRGGRPRCVYKGKDDMDLIMDKFLKADGIIVSVPCFVLQPQGIYKVFIDRWLPYEVALLLEAKIIDKAPQRVGAVITAGGSTQNWMSLTLPALQISMFMQSIKVVDQMMATRVARPGHVVLKPELLERARTLGRNVVQAIQTPYDQVKWLGDPNEGWCPVCHSNLMMQGKPHWDGTAYDIECAMCGAGGSLKVEEGKAVFVLASNGLEHCRIFSEGRKNHFYEIMETQKQAFQNLANIKAGCEKYKNHAVPVVKSAADQHGKRGRAGLPAPRASLRKQ